MNTSLSSDSTLEKFCELGGGLNTEVVDLVEVGVGLVLEAGVGLMPVVEVAELGGLTSFLLTSNNSFSSESHSRHAKITAS